MKDRQLIQREYRCDNTECGDGMKFMVIHKDLTSRQQRCVWCGVKPTETGITEEIVGDMIIKKLWGKEIAQRPRPGKRMR